MSEPRGPIEQFLDEQIAEHFDDEPDDAVEEFVFDLRRGIKESDDVWRDLVNALEVMAKRFEGELRAGDGHWLRRTDKKVYASAQRALAKAGVEATPA